MKLVRSVLLVMAVVALAGLAASSALAAKSLPITASYSGQASTKVNGDVADISANGTGKGTFGAGSITGTGTGDASKQPCVPFGGTGTMTGAAGTSIAFKVTSGASGCGDEGGHVFSVKGTVAVVKATGKLAKAKGSLRFTGVYDRDGGTFSVKFTGTLAR